VMRALAKDPDQRYGSAEEMDADLARVARGVAVSQKTEEAMTQVLAGAGAATAATMITRPRTVTTPPAYRPPAAYYEETPGRRSVWPWLLGLLACAIAAAGGYLLYQKIQDQWKQTAPIAVVDVRNIHQKLAVQKLKAQGFDVKIQTESSDTIPADDVIDQSPSPGSRIARSSTVTIFVSTGKERVIVPDVRHLPLNDAIARLNDVHLNPDVHDVYSPATVSTVVGQAPKAGDKVLANSKVRLNVSQGPKQISIPNVVGTPFPNAQSALEGAGFVVVRKDEPSDQPKGEVTATDPQGGTTARQGTKVTVTVSKGPATAQVPDVTGRQQTEAVTLLQQAGFLPTIVKEDVTDPSQDGLVLAEVPAGGQKARQGTTVTITVGHLVQQPETTPSTTTATTTAPSTTTATTTTAVTTTSTP
jgi:beta-lactam-binding protein with PASTA domain